MSEHLKKISNINIIWTYKISNNSTFYDCSFKIIQQNGSHCDYILLTFFYTNSRSGKIYFIQGNYTHLLRSRELV